MPRPWCDRGCRCSRCWASAATDHRGHTRHQRCFDLLRANPVDVGVDTSCGENLPFTCNHFGCCTKRNGNIWLNIRIPCFTNFPDSAIFKTHISFDNAPPIDNEDIGNDRIGNGISQHLRLAHPITNHFTATELDFFAIGG